MENAARPIVVPPEDLRTLNVLGSLTSFRLTGDQTGGLLSLYEINDGPGVGIPLHVHEREDELFHVITGRVSFNVGDRETVAGPGTTVFGPRGTPHAWRVTEGPAQMLIQVTPAGMEAMFAELSALGTGGPPDLAAVAEVCGRYGIRFG